MSKNTGTSELINYFDLGANGDVGIAGSLDVNTIANATTDTDKFLVSDTGIIKYRTGTELLSDIGAAPAVAGGYVPYTGATTNVDLGIYNITAHTIRATGSANNAGQINLRSDAIFSLVNGYGTIGSGTTNQFNFYQTTGAGVFRGAIFSLNSITASATRTFTLPDADGTIALTSSLSGYLPLTGGTMTGSFQGVTGSNFVGTSVNARLLVTASGVANTVIGFNNSGSTTDGVTNNTAYLGVLQDFPLVLTTNSIERFRIAASTGAATFSSSVFAGGGTSSSPSGADTVIGAYGAQDCSLILQDNVQLWELYVNDDFYINRGSTNVLTALRSNGNVGIGVTNPLYTLHAKAASGSTTGLRLESSGGTTNFDILASEGDGNAYLYQRSNYGILIGTNNSLRMTITSGGNVLVGTPTDAGVKLDVLGTARISGNSTYAEFSLKDNTASGSTWFLLSGFPALGDFTIREAGVANHLVIKKTSGNVGIGTDTPSRKLQVVGAGTSTSGDVVAVRNDNSVSGAFINFIAGGNNAPSMGAKGNDLVFTADNYSGAELMRITSVGKTLLLGSTTSPWANSTRSLLELNNTGSVMLGLRISGNERAYFYHNNSNLYIENMLNPGSIYVISISGGVYLTAGGTSWTSNSDGRLKNINGNIENALDKLMTLRAVNFSWKNDKSKKENLGLIAQDVEKVFPQVIDINKLPSKPNQEQEDETEYLGVRYQDLIPVLIKAIQELNEKINK